MENVKIISVLTILGLLVFTNCSKPKNSSTVSSLYTPTTTDVTPNATLAELQSGRTLYIANCGTCHNLYSPDAYSTSQWKTILSNMTPKTSLNSSDVLLVTKYVCRGKQ